jgi:hypothetical protein
MRALRITAGMVAVLTLWSSGAVLGSSQPAALSSKIVADVDGRSINPASIPSFYCHDFDYPRIHCSRSAAGLKVSEAKIARSSKSVSPYFGVNDYVTIFDGPNYSGSFMDVSQNYDVLFSIGWNDRISSYKARNSDSGIFWTDWFASGSGVTFCCNTNVSSLPASLDNAFSSMYRR